MSRVARSDFYRFKSVEQELSEEKKKVVLPDMERQNEIKTLQNVVSEQERKIKKLEGVKKQYKQEWIKAIKYVYQLEKGVKPEPAAPSEVSGVETPQSMKSDEIKSTLDVEQEIEADEKMLQDLRAVTGKLGKLLKEKELLLSTGVYGEDDALIQELNSRIRELSV